MYQFKGFIGLETLVSNITGEVAPVGELSTYGLTFSKDVGIYTFPANKSLTIYGFSSKSDADGIVAPVQEILDMGFTISNWIYGKQTSTIIPETKISFLAALNAQFLVQCDSLDCGEMVESIGGYWFPEWVTWKNRTYIVENNFNKIWFCDDSFRRQYDEFDIVVIPPVTNVDFFFQPASNVTTEVNSRNFTATLELIRITRDNIPETILAAEIFDYVNPLNTANKIPTNWSLLIYGPRGDDPDMIITAISEYILANSSHTLAEWKVVFPDIFKRTEFSIFPRWHNYAIPNMTLEAGIYSPSVNLNKEITYLKEVLVDYGDVHVGNYATVMAIPYKSLALAIVGGFENRDNLFELNQIFPDIINVSTTSNDFNRMAMPTQTLLKLLANMIPIAETMTQYTDIPVGMRRTVRNGIMYLTANYLKVQYLIATKLTTPDYSGGV